MWRRIRAPLPTKDQVLRLSVSQSWFRVATGVRGRVGRRRLRQVSTQPTNTGQPEHEELPVEELLRRARPFPSHEEMAIDDLSDEEAAAFLAAVES